MADFRVRIAIELENVDPAGERRRDHPHRQQSQSSDDQAERKIKTQFHAQIHLDPSEPRNVPTRIRGESGGRSPGEATSEKQRFVAISSAEYSTAGRGILPASNFFPIKISGRRTLKSRSR